MKNPYEWELAVWGYSSLATLSGFFVGWYNRFKHRKPRVFRWLEFLSECACGVVIGHTAHLLCLGFGFNASQCLACAAVGGALSSRAFGWLNMYADGKIKTLSGVKHNDENQDKY